MPSRSSKDHDFTTVARRVVEQAIGEKLDGGPLPDKDVGKNPAARWTGSKPWLAELEKQLAAVQSRQSE